jgi:hypothetical protein
MWWKKATFHNYFIVSVIISIISAVLILVSKQFLPPVLPIFYGRPAGAEQLAPFWYIFLIPSISIAIITINLIINILIESLFTKKILAITSLVVSLMSTITIIKIILLVALF